MAQNLSSRLRARRLRGADLDGVVLRHGDPVTAAYILFWAHVWWAVPLAVNPDQLAQLDLFAHFPLLLFHVWDGLALMAALLLRLGLTRSDFRVVQVGAVLSAAVWVWADVAFLAAAWPNMLTSLVYTALAGTSVWVVFLTRAAWVDGPPPR